MQKDRSAGKQMTDPDKYPVYPEDDGRDIPRNPYGPH